MLRGGSISFLRFVLRRGIFAALTATSAAASAAAVAAAARLVLAALNRALGFRRAGRTRGFRRVGSFAARLALARGAALAVLVGIAGRTFAARLIAARGALASLFGGLVATLLGRVFTLRRGGLLAASPLPLPAASAAASRVRRGGNGAFPSPPRQRRGRPLLRRGPSTVRAARWAWQTRRSSASAAAPPPAAPDSARGASWGARCRRASPLPLRST